MYIRTKDNQGKHDAAVAVWARSLISNGWKKVYADLPGNIKPPLIGGHIPDIYAVSGMQEVIIEVETVDSINTEHTKSQLAVFELWKRQSSNRIYLVKLG